MEMDKNAVGHDLQDTLVELTDLALQAKQAHWNVAGPNFRPVHLHLDELTDEVRAASDEVAERATAIGFYPDARASTVASNSPLGDFPAGRVRDRDVVQLMADRLGIMTKRLRDRADRLDDVDKTTQDILLGVLATLDKHHWMFEVQTQR